jgi:hypothetical protein
LQPDPKLVEELKAKHGDDIHQLGMPKGVEADRDRAGLPTTEMWDRMQDRVLDPRATQATKRAAARNILIDVLLYPSRDELGALLDRRPGLVQTLSNQLLGIAGMEPDLPSEKL